MYAIDDVLLHDYVDPLPASLATRVAKPFVRAAIAGSACIAVLAKRINGGS